MCRWFAYISPKEPCLLSDVLITPANSISKQCSEHYLPKLLPHGDDKDLNDASDELLRIRNSLLNMDGLGVAWYTEASSTYVKHVTGPRPALYKSQSPPFNDFNFKSLCENTETHCVFAHIRATSGSVVTPVNSHPFVFGRHIFMHNGVVSNFSSIRRDMTDLLSFDAYCNVLGSTDSEHAAALYMTNLTNGAGKESWDKPFSLKAMFEAMRKTVVQILQLQHDILGADNVPNSLNFCTTDGTKLLAIRFRNHVTQQPPSLYWSEFAGRTLNTKYPGHPDGGHMTNMEATLGEEERIGKHTIVASEPTTFDEGEWHLISKNCALLVDEEGTETEVEIEYEGGLNARDPKYDSQT
ncbi:N-terminal nucleophile aminohydrolase [Dothidotthia symphoricarpi CBS 119687]|uniref:N-terminal nucleophile aminohydrolase n=1 Tax=Dothidotthia symphoricarpi CBS 119687 TaxID=1392245 RepID=A0A6A6A944_9PLEO|nr:N-terminal nucleophile aminohydrolase [Dothidotthia symphoricarpi CBS 119687]KAF2127624.1 N-terminal nucleophile aminohydrolase [Dothidotthia symphoricarpi CBS 119687]